MPWKEAKAGHLDWACRAVPVAPPPVGDAEGVCMHVDETCDSHLARGAAHPRRRVDAGAHSPDAAFWSRRHSIETSCARRRTTPYEKRYTQRSNLLERRRRAVYVCKRAIETVLRCLDEPLCVASPAPAVMRAR